MGKAYRFLWRGLLAAAFVAGGFPALVGHAAEGPWLDRSTIQVERTDQGATLRCEVTNPLPRAGTAALDIAVRDFEGNVWLRGQERWTLEPGKNDCALALTGSLAQDKVPQCFIAYELKRQWSSEKGTRSLMAALAQLETRVVSYRDLQAGSRAGLRLVALNHATGSPVEGADVSLALVANGAEQRLLSAKTDANGTLEARFDVPRDVLGQAELAVSVSAGSLGQDQVKLPVSVKREAKILLTTDKPLYQPGQLVHIRALCLATGALQPRASEPLVFEIMDAKGNKVFKRKTNTDQYGIASAEFQLASEVNLGDYIVRAILGETQSEKQVTVDRYVLPKFKVNVKTDKDYYLPGETLKGEVQADYFFGKPVAGGKVTVKASKFEIQFEEFAKVEGTLDDKGHWSFETPLPAYFAGTPIEQGQASVRLEVFVVDTADHREEKVAMTPVAAAPLIIHAVPESGVLVPGLENRVYVLVAYPDGKPAAAAKVTVGGQVPNAEIETDALGIATLTVPAAATPELALTLEARDNQGRSAQQKVTLSGKGKGEGLLLRTDKALYQVGETIQAEVIATKPKGNVYFDFIRDGQTVMTQAAELKDGRASLGLDVDAGMSGSAVLQAYVFTPGTDIVRDSRRLYVNPADALTLGIALDKETYRPGEKATVQFAITGKGGAPTPSAIGVSIVDESVFALQEIHPGLEKVYFTLEQEIMKPRFEIHGYELQTLVKGPVPEPGAPVPQKLWTDQQQEAARVLLASAPPTPEPPVKVNTFQEKQAKADEVVAERYAKDFEHVQQAVMKYLERHLNQAPEDMLDGLLREKYLRQNEILDPWGNPYEFDFSYVAGGNAYFTMASCGPDEVKGTADDLSPNSPWGAKVLRGRGRRQMWFDQRNGRFVEQELMAEMAMPMAAAAPDMEPPPMAKRAMRADGIELDMAKKANTNGGAAPGGAGPVPPRLREYFPETLLFEPALITDAQGHAVLDVAMADSITTWRMTAMASSSAGALGSKDSSMRVFQDFFVDLDLPVALTQHDRVSIPVVLYNYLEGPQEVRLKFEQEPWFKLEGDPEKTIQLASQEVRSMYFPIEVVELGHHMLTVTADGAAMSDAIRREIDVLPDGEEQNVTFSDRLSGRIEHAIAIPADAIPGASKILVRVYPGVFSQIVDGLDSMLQMPSGCFEQTSSSTYPNILIVQYMKATKQINPEIQMKAEGFINAGYQRLLAYEVQGGGFSWFGDAPANKILTAWGLKEFFEMSQVHEVDPAVIERTSQWLAGLQEGDGSWKPDANYLHAESWGGIQKSDVLVTAYVADAILSTGDKGAATQKAIEYLKANWKASQEPYTLALVANACVSNDPKDAFTKQVLDALYNARQEDKDTVYWKSGAGTVTFTHGDAADVETTALAAIALLKAGQYPEATTKALTYLIRKKSAQGHWGSTQATILALKALTISLGNRTDKVNATVSVTLNGESVSELTITPDDSDVMRLVDLGEKTKPGANAVTLEIKGEGSMLYQVVGRYYLPWAQKPQPQALMSIDVQYDKRELAVNDLVKVSVTVVNNRPAAAQMVIVDLGIPPGFQVMTPDLDELVKKGVLQKYELTGRQIITYFDKLEANARVQFSYTLRAKFPLRAQTPQSRVYEYYNRDIQNTAVPQQLVVQ